MPLCLDIIQAMGFDSYNDQKKIHQTHIDKFFEDKGAIIAQNYQLLQKLASAKRTSYKGWDRRNLMFCINRLLVVCAGIRVLTTNKARTKYKIVSVERKEPIRPDPDVSLDTLDGWSVCKYRDDHTAHMPEKLAKEVGYPVTKKGHGGRKKQFKIHHAKIKKPPSRRFRKKACDDIDNMSLDTINDFSFAKTAISWLDAYDELDPARGPGLVYFIREHGARDGFYVCKIGKTGGSPEKRADDLRVGNCHGLTLIAWMTTSDMSGL